MTYIYTIPLLRELFYLVNCKKAIKVVRDKKREKSMEGY